MRVYSSPLERTVRAKNHGESQKEEEKEEEEVIGNCIVAISFSNFIKEVITFIILLFKLDAKKYL